MCKHEQDGAHLSILTDSDIFERWLAMEFDFVDQNANAASVGGDLARWAAQPRSLFLFIRKSDFFYKKSNFINELCIAYGAFGFADVTQISGCAG